MFIREQDGHAYAECLRDLAGLTLALQKSLIAGLL
jgi:hypothetical protein